MRIYAQTPVKRASQLAGDPALLAWIAVWIQSGRALHGLIRTSCPP